MTESILQEAERIINGPRRDDYGPVEESFEDIAKRWTQELGSKLASPLTSYDVVHLMVQLKLSRAKNGYHRDSYVDICGYAGLTEKLAGPAEEDTSKDEVIEVWGYREPQVWKGLDAVNYEYKVVDRCGTTWTHPGRDVLGGLWRDECGITKPFGESYSHLGPFTEVLDG